MTEIVGLRFVVQGEKDVVRALEEYSKTKMRLVQALEQTLGAFAKGENRLQRFARELGNGRIPVEVYNKALSEISRQMAQLSGVSVARAREEVERFNRALQAEQADRARQAFDKFVASFDNTARAARRLVQAQEVVNRAVETGAITAEQGETTMRRFRAALEDTSRAAQLLQREKRALAAAFNPVLAAQMAMETRQEQLNRALSLGVITADQFEAELQRMRAAFEQVGNDSLRAQLFVTQFGQIAHIAGQKTNKFGLVAQQVGYQVTDFFVQVQSGTNVFVAFGQQATQLLGLLPGVLGAVSGISVSIVTMLLSMWSRSRDVAEQARKIEQAYRDVGDALRRLDMTDLTRSAQGFLNIVQQVRQQFQEVIDLMERAATRDLQRALGNVVKPLQDSFDVWRQKLHRELDRVIMGFGFSPGPGVFLNMDSQTLSAVADEMARVRGIVEAQPPAGIDTFGLQTYRQLAQVLASIKRIQGATRADLQQTYLTEVRRLETAGLLTAEIETILVKLGEELGINELINETLDQRTKIQQRLQEATRKNIEELRKSHSGLLDEVNERSRLLTLVQSGLTFAEAEARIAKEKKQDELAALALRGRLIAANTTLTAQERAYGAAIERQAMQALRQLRTAESLKIQEQQRLEREKARQQIMERYARLLEQNREAAQKESVKLEQQLRLRNVLTRALAQGATEEEAREAVAREAAAMERERLLALAAQRGVTSTIRDKLVEQVEQLEKLEALERALVAAAKAREEAEAKRARWQEQTHRTLEQQLESLSAQNTETARVTELVSKGASLEYARAIYAREARQAELLRLEAMARALLQSQGITEEMRATALALLEAVARARELDVAFANASRNAYQIPQALGEALALMNALQSQLRSEAFASIERGAVLAALRGGATGDQARLAGEIARIRAESEQRRRALLAAGEGPNSLIMQAEARMTEERIQAAIKAAAENAEISALMASGRGGGGAGKSVKTLAEIVAGLEEQIARERELLELNERQRLERELYYQIVDQLRQQGVAYNEEAVRQAAAYLAAQKQITEELRRQQQMQDWLANSLTNLWMGALDGANAFRRALAGVLQQLSQMIANAAFKSLMSGTGFGQGLAGVLSVLVTPSAKGNVFAGGNVIAFAGGGVIGGPTLFPMQGGRMGLMGEAGPEAIMPLRRGRDGKLGVAAQSAVALDVRVSVDDDGRLQAYVRNVSRDTVKEAVPVIVRSSVAATYRANSERRMR